ncbi:MFS transporter [Microbispora sp. RL4-1S]|uniref:MFS transporter n=2 Tax=Microbispora oryzae TaxID=2806554 RepID=A0A940WRI3_9ACTN|nr:MFS transporter [Microbispora oryzae]
MTRPRVFAPRYRAVSTGFVALSLLVAFEYLAVATAMPRIGRELHGYHLYALAFSGNLAANIIATLVGGRWSDARGPGAALWAGVGGFIAGLAVSGLAPGMEVFLAGRFLQGFGGGLFNVALYVLVARVYPAPLHPRVFSLLAAAWVLPSIVGPALTGIVAERWSWRWVFLGVAVVAVPAALVMRRGLRTGGEKPAAGPAGELPAGEVSGATAPGFPRRLAWGVLAALGAALLQYGSGTPESGIPLAAAGLAALALSLPRLLPSGALRAARGLPAVVALRGLAAGSFFAAEVFVPLTLTAERGLSTAQAGLALTGGAVAWSFGSWIQGRLPGARVRTLRLGTALIALGVSITALTVFRQVPVAVAFGGWMTAGLGIGMVFPTLSVLVLELSAPGEQGRASASMSIGESALSIVAVALTGALYAVFRGTPATYLVCFGLLVVMAATGTALADRVRPEPERD